MLFAALLSSAFLVLVASNGRQVGRETDRAEASRNADAGVAKVKQWLLASSTPDTWDPTQDINVVATSSGVAVVPPAPGSADYDFYWSPLDQAMGWADPNAGFAKYPDPRTSRQAAQFLVSAHVLGKNEPTVGYDDMTSGGDKRFMLRITVIGLSTKNPESWTRRVLYKTTNWNGATFSFGNLVTNTAFIPNAQGTPVPTDLSGAVDTTATGGVSLTTPNATVTIPLISSSATSLMVQPGNTLMVSDGKTEPIVGIVQSGSPTSVVLRLVHSAGTTATPVTVNYPQYSKVTASVIGSLFENTAQIDENGDGNGVPATNEGPTLAQGVVGVGATPVPATQPFGNGAFFNNGLIAPTSVTFGARPPISSNGTSTYYAGQNALTSTGPVTVGDSPTTTEKINLIDVKTTTPVAIAYPTAQPVDNRFLRLSFAPNGKANADTFTSAVDPEVTPRRVVPGQIDVTKYAGLAQAAGLYINNPGDIEKFGSTPLTSNQLQRFWQRKSFPVTSAGNIAYTGANAPVATGTDNYARLCYGRPGVDSYVYPMTTGSLEQKGIRGWISPWEFLPRGAQIILNGTSVTVIQDPLSDSSTDKPDPAKAFNSTNRTYTQTGTPTNGIICAEGNVRVRGNWTGTPLTIVSGSNIYIEGTLSSRDGLGNLLQGKIALLAKKNVVLNPTQFIARPTGTVDTSVGRDAVTGTANTGALTVSDDTKFKLGDKIAVFSETGAAFDGWRTIMGFAGGGVLTLDSALPSTYNGNVKVKLACDPPVVLASRDLGANVPGTEHFLPTTGDAANKDATITELAVTPANLATAGTFWAYSFSKGGDTLARNVPFNAPIGIAMRETVAKKNVLFTVQGGDDRNNPTTPINDDGNRTVESRTSATNPFELRLTPKSGTATDPPPNPNYDVFDLQQLTGSPSDATSNLTTLRTQLKNLSSNDTDDKANRWRLILPAPVAPATMGVEDLLAARRLAKGNITASLGQNPDDETDPLQSFRVPLTSSVVLFSGPLGTVAPESTALSRIGSTFGFQTAAVDATKETRFINAIDLAKAPVWDQSTASGSPGVVKYTQFSNTNDVAWTRDGAGDYNDQLPAYYISGWRFQKVVADTTTPTAGNSVAATTGAPKTNMTTEVDATIYAEGGSWFVISVPTPNANVAVPTDADQQVEWRRPAYAITVNGNIAQMMTPTAIIDYDDEPDADGVALGAMQRWTDSLAYQVNDGATTRWQTINYKALPLPALDTTTTTGYAAIPRLPASTDILYTYSN